MSRWSKEMQQAWFDAQVFQQVWRDPGVPAGWIVDRINQPTTVQAVTASLKRLVDADLVERLDRPNSYSRSAYIVEDYGLHRIVRERMGFVDNRAANQNPSKETGESR